MDINSLRRQIPATRRMTYMNTGWAGPMPNSVMEAIRARLEYEGHSGPTAAAVLESAEQVRGQARVAVASLINASPEEVLLTQNTTEGINVVMNGLPWQEGDEVITCDLEHPSILLPTYHLQRRRGVKVKVLAVAPHADHETIVLAVEEAMTDRTRMVFLSHVEYSCGLRMPIEQIGRLTGARGVWLLVDGAQGPGHVPVDVPELGCDFYAMSGQKWLLGPDGTGALFIRDSIVPVVEPASVGYYSVKSYDYAGGYEPETEDIDKLKVSTTSTPLRAGFLEAIRFVRDIGIGDIAARSMALAATLKAALSGVPGVKVLSPMEGPGCSGLVSFAVEGADHKEAVARLWESSRILVRPVKYPDSIRASTAFFNTEEEVAMLVEAVRGLA